MARVPDLSVVVPTLERPTQLAACLGALGRIETTAGGVEVIVADESGEVDEDDARDAAGPAVPVRVIRTAARGPAAARNAGAGAARGALLAFTDDDCEPQPAWAKALLERHATAPEALVGGRTVNGLTANPYARAAQAITDAALAHHNGGPAGPRFFPSNNLAIPAARFAELGGFDERLQLAGGEDRDLCERWRERGWPLASAPGAVVRHCHPLDLRGFIRQQAAYGRGAYHHRMARAERGGEMRLEPSLTSGIFSGAAAGAIRERDLGRFALLWVWQLANLAGFAGAALRARARAAGRRASPPRAG
jgi:GT2 family glycosyltransferase